MNKTLATVALAAIPALLFSACNGNTAGTNAMVPVPNAPGSVQSAASHRMHPNDTGPQDLHAGGATFPAYAYNLASQPVGTYQDNQPGPGAGSLFFKAGTKGNIYYCLTGSGAGRKVFDGDPTALKATDPCAQLGQTPTGFGGRQDPLDFVGSDVALTSAEYAIYKTNREPSSGQSWGEPFEFPTIGGPIVYGFRPGDFSASKIKLSTWSYCAIANGTVSNWNDPALTADNGSSLTGGVSQPITFYYRSDSSGTSYLFTNHLNTACNKSWKAPYNKPPYQSSGHSAGWPYGVNSTWPGPNTGNFIGESGNPGVLAAIQSTAYSTGYLEGAYAKSASPAVSQTLMQNGFTNGSAIFVDPTNAVLVQNALKKVKASAITYGGGSDGVPLGTSRPECVLYIDPSKFVSPPAKAYPIVGLSYMLFYGHNNGVHLKDKKKLINFMVSSAANTIVSGFEYAPLTLSVHNAITSALKGSGGKTPCVQ